MATDDIDTDARDPEVGEELTVVVVHPNEDTDRDPAAKVGGKTAYIRFDSGYQPSFSEVVDIRVADVMEHNLLLVPADPETYRERAENDRKN